MKLTIVVSRRRSFQIASTLPAYLAQLPALRQRFAGENMLETMSTIVLGWMVAADSVLFHGAAGRAGPGDGLHAVDAVFTP
jgi:hypothetical protein